ncbi:unnamed protein product [Oikopleura dioica]|uniref:Enkurin domain-containing protein n=1 Tax=Oikopleura dioica TaxID=34765 RepID=E4XNC9_OIKDI|nr:unnamed protein product [Oikopleura dioica]
MSYGSEHVNGIIPQPIEKILKEKMHISKFRPQAASEYRSGAKPCKTMGPAKVPLNKPENFLKKHETRPGDGRDVVAKFIKNGETLKPPVPANAPFDSKQLLRSKKDFITKNALDVINARQRMPTEKIVDDVNGQADKIECSGLVPKYTKKKNFGKVPNYICIRKEHRAAAFQDYQNWIYEREALQQSVRILSEAERMEVVAGLKKNWEESNVRYQGLSVITDTAPKKKRKQKIEAEMKQLERDIDMIESHKYIYVEQ